MNEPWIVHAASACGALHERLGLPCQDAHAYAMVGEVAIAAVADGMGSAEHAELGATCAVGRVIVHLQRWLADTVPDTEEDWCALMQSAFVLTRVDLEQRASELGLPLRSLATTLLTVVMTPDWLITAQIGDGAIVALGFEAEIVLVSRPQRGEYANETWPLTAPDAAAVAQYSAHRRAVRGVALFTDGLQNLALNEARGEPFAPFFRHLFGGLTRFSGDDLGRFLRSPRVRSRTDDDTTLLLAARRESYGTRD